MEDEEELALHLPHDAFPNAPQGHDLATLRRGERRVDRAQQRGADDAGALERLPDDPGGQRLEGDRDVGELGPGPPVLSTEKPGAPPPPPPTPRPLALPEPSASPAC